MDLIVDTWNVLHQTGVLPPDSAGIGTAGLCRMIENSRWRGERVTLVCDGTFSDDEEQTGSRYQVVFTGPHKTADEEIMELVAKSSAPRSILVITSDREIIKSTRKRGAQQIGSSSFLQALVEDSHLPKTKITRRPSGLSPKLAQEWKEHFGINDEVLEELHDTPMPQLHQEQVSEKKQIPKPTHNTKSQKERTVKPEEPSLPADVLEEARKLLEG
ncbi:MAG: NYN domain-containing protein [Phycisphaerales bacterium]|jgi:predicted RNA-binding protein with PIN domain|nr:NYN domain-containing protein [Phycisphaerales bacterium]